MEHYVISKFLHHLNIVQSVVLTVGVGICFVIAVSIGHVTFYVPFISETGAHKPERGIFSFTLTLGSILGIIFILYRYVAILLSTSAEKRTLLKLNKLSCLFGVIAMIGLAGVAAFPVTSIFSVHITFAIVFFCNFMLYTSLNTVFACLEMNSLKLLKFRVMLSICIFIATIFLIITFPLSLKKWNKHNKKSPALKDPDNEGFFLVLVSSCFEWLYMFLSLLYISTMNMDLQQKKFKIIYHTDESDVTAPDTEGTEAITTDSGNEGGESSVNEDVEKTVK